MQKYSENKFKTTSTLTVEKKVMELTKKLKINVNKMNTY